MAAQNPVFNAKTLKSLISSHAAEDSATMTVPGSINKASLLMLMMIATSVISYNIADTGLGSMLALVSIVLNLILCLVLVRMKQRSAILAPIYALVEGFSIGAISAWANEANPGVAANAIILTFSCVCLMLGLYKFRIVVVTERLRSVIVAASLAIAVTYLVDLGCMLFGTNIPMIHTSGWMGIGFSLAVVGIAASNLLLDFDMIEKAVEQRAPKWMEWYAGFALLVTVVWLYVEVLRLLGKLSRK